MHSCHSPYATYTDFAKYSLYDRHHGPLPVELRLPFDEKWMLRTGFPIYFDVIGNANARRMPSTG